MNLATLTDRELARHAYISHDPLTTTDLERELLRRLEEPDDTLLDDTLTQALDGAGLEPEDLPALVRLLEEFNATDLESLREKLSRADKWFDIAEEAGELFQQLHDLTKATV